MGDEWADSSSGPSQVTTNWNSKGRGFTPRDAPADSFGSDNRSGGRGGYGGDRNYRNAGNNENGDDASDRRGRGGGYRGGRGDRNSSYSGGRNYGNDDNKNYGGDAASDRRGRGGGYRGRGDRDNGYSGGQNYGNDDSKDDACNRRGRGGGYRGGRGDRNNGCSSGRNYGNEDSKDYGGDASDRRGNSGGYGGGRGDHNDQAGRRNYGDDTSDRRENDGGYRGSRGYRNGYNSGDRQNNDDGTNDRHGNDYGRRGYRNDDNNDNDSEELGNFGGGRGGRKNYEDNDRDENGGGNRRDGGSRGGGRGGRHNYDDDNDNKRGDDQDNKNEEKNERPPLYVPEDLPDDDESLFGTGIQTGINFKKYDSIKIKCDDETAPLEIKTFEQSGLRDLVLENVSRSGYKIPTPVQRKAIPCILAGRDVMATAQTGSGKTAAFALPIVSKLLETRRDLTFDGTHCEPHVIVLCPTRELAIQTQIEFMKFSKHTYLKTGILYGGAASFNQRNKLLEGRHIVVATPGRLVDFINRGTVTLSGVQFVVLDEADRMLDQGFKDPIDLIMNHTTMVSVNERQTLMFSATCSKGVQQLATNHFKSDYVFFSVGIIGGACDDVEQVFYEVDKKDKRKKLIEILRETNAERTLIFIQTKLGTDYLAANLSENGFPTTSIHGNRFQQQREEALKDFKNGKFPILAATGVASRGLDIKGIDHVINYDLPNEIDEYVHRIGRTGRLGNRGKATTFFDRAYDSKIAPQLVNILQCAEQNIPGWLNQYADGSDYQAEEFGGYDYRTNQQSSNNRTSNDGAPKAVVEEEAWD